MDALKAQQDEMVAKSSTHCRRTTRTPTRKANASKPKSTGSTLPSSRLKAARLTWDAQQMAEAGAFVMVSPQGELVIERGLVRREEQRGTGCGGRDRDRHAGSLNASTGIRRDR
jgi:ParB family chromosome partitioning protein